MGLFDFLKSKKSDSKSLGSEMERLSATIFPKGDKDVVACVDELLRILENNITRDEARDILLKSVAISRIAQNFDVERLRSHLAPYALQHFSEKQLGHFWSYLVGIQTIMITYRKTPSEITWDGSKYIW